MELQKPFRRQFLGAWILWIMQYFSKLMKDDPQWNVKLYSENEFENVIKVVRGEKWQFYMCCILPLFSPAKLGGESDQEEKLAATLDKTFFQLQTFAKMFLSLIHTSYKKLTTILQVTYRLDTPTVSAVAQWRNLIFKIEFQIGCPEKCKTKGTKETRARKTSV